MFHSKNTLFTHPSISSKSDELSWDIQNHTHILQFARAHPDSVGVFDADGTLWSQDIERAFFRWFFSQHQCVNTNYNRNSYHEYEERTKIDGLAAYLWLLKALAGIPEHEMEKIAANFFQDYFINYIYPGQIQLVAELKKIGLDIWVVSASNQWLVKAGAAYLGIDPSHVLAVRLEVKNKILTDNILEPFPYQEGKVLAINQFIAKKPMLVFGDSQGDIPMLKESGGLSIYIKHEKNQTDAALDLAKEYNWLVQYFPLTSPIQFDNFENVPASASSVMFFNAPLFCHRSNR